MGGGQFEIPKGFKERTVIGKNINLSLTDENGASINIVVKEIDIAYRKSVKIEDMNLNSNSEWEAILNENMDRVHILKKGLTYLGVNEAFYMRYTFYGQEENVTYYVISYCVSKNNKLFTINATCDYSIFSSFYEAIFFRAIQSFKI